MSDLVKPSADERDTNFQRASMTLDAGVKIYATRVDSVHTAAYQVLTGLSRSGPAAAGVPLLVVVLLAGPMVVENCVRGGCSRFLTSECKRHVLNRG